MLPILSSSSMHIDIAISREKLMEAQSRRCPLPGGPGLFISLATVLFSSLSLKIKTVQKVSQDHPPYQGSTRNGEGWLGFKGTTNADLREVP